MDSPLDVAVEAVRDRASLGRIFAQWEDLARRALEPLHDPATLLALLETAGEGGFHCCLSWGRDPERSDLPATLGAVFPFLRERSAWGFESWILLAPLVGAEDAQRHLAALLDWLPSSGASVIELRHLPHDGRLNDALADALRERWPGLRNLTIGLGAMGVIRVSMRALLERAKRRIARASRGVPPPVAA